MILELDAGNTRVKWRLMKAHEGQYQKAEEDSVVAIKKTASVINELGLQLGKIPHGDIHSIRVANVRGEEFKTGFTAYAAEKWQIHAEFAIVEKTCAGVSNSYRDLQKMGVDRWLAMLAAFHECQSACCIVDCGSAITIDLIDDQGQHRGGYIVPGLTMMHEGLAHKSAVFDFTVDFSDNSARDKLTHSIEPGITTESAVTAGIINMATGLLERIHSQQCNLSDQVNWFVTGGDSKILSRNMEWEHKRVPDLVMEGLAFSIKQERSL